MGGIKEPVLLSLKVAFLSTTIVTVLAIVVARFFARHQFRGKNVLESILLLPMVLPPSVLGYLLLIVLGKNGFVGKFLQNNVGVSIIFTWGALVVASCVVSFPLMYQNAKAGFLAVDLQYENTARILGASEWKIFLEITLPLAWPGIISGVCLTFARAMGEFGASLMVAGNIPGKTQTIPIGLYYAVERNDMATANQLMAIVLSFSFLLIYFLNRWLAKKRLR